MIYCRISQARDGQTVKVDRQERDCRKLAASLGLKVIRLYVDNDLSAANPKVTRPQFEEMLAARPEAIVTFHEDRLIKQTADLERVIRLGVNVHSTLAGRLDLSNPTGRAVARTVVAWTQFEGEHKGERQAAANRDRAERGIPWTSGYRTFGFTADGAILEAEAARVREAFADVLAGVSVRMILRQWHEQGVTTSTGRTPWPPRTFRDMLQRPVYAGRRIYRGEDIGPTAAGPIVDPDLFAAVQVLLNDPTRNNRAGVGPGPKHLLSGIARCGVLVDGVECGALLTTGQGRRSDRPNEPTYRTLKCTASRHLDRRMAPIEDRVVELLIARLRRKDAARLFRIAAPDTGPLRTRAAALRAQREALAVDLDVAHDFAAARDRRLRDELGKIEAEIAEKSRGNALGKFAGGRDPAEVWAALENDLDTRRAIVRELVDVVALSPKRGNGSFDPASVRVTPR